jgi:hypothetical protein
METFLQWPLHGQVGFVFLVAPGALALLFMLIAYPYLLIQMARGKWDGGE